MRKIKFLLGNNTLSLLGGSETWTKTLALSLKNMGHEVSCFSPELGVISKILEDENIPCFNRVSTNDVEPFSVILEPNTEHDYDVIIANHNHIVDYLREQFPKVPIISTIHGVLHKIPNEHGEDLIAPEHPALNAGVNQFIAVSEEVKEILKNLYGLDSIVIRNFIDINVFKSKKKISKGKPNQILFNSNYNTKDDDQVKMIREVANHYGAKLTALGQNFTPNPDVNLAIEDADIVVGMGRSVLEGMAMGRIGIVQGRWGTAGVIHKGNVDEIKVCNFSGRNTGGKFMTSKKLIEQIDRYYNNLTASWGAEYIRSFHNAFLAAEEIVGLSEGLLEQKINKPKEVKKIPYRKQRDVNKANNQRTDKS